MQTAQAILPEKSRLWLYLSQTNRDNGKNTLHCLSAPWPQGPEPDPEIIRYVAREQRLQISHHDHMITASGSLYAVNAGRPSVLVVKPRPFKPDVAYSPYSSQVVVCIIISF